MPATELRMAELHEKLLESHDLADFLQHLVGVAASVIRNDVSCGITVFRNGQPTTVASSDPRASAVDEIQYELDYGPCLHSARTREKVFVKDFAEEDDDWEKFRTRAMEVGIHSSLSMPLQTEVGAINLYAAVPDAFRPEEVVAAERFGEESDRAIALAVRLTEQARVAGQLKEALTSRAVIDRAVGVVMAQNRCDEREAFRILSKASQNSNRKLRDVAAAVVHSVAGEPGHLASASS